MKYRDLIRLQKGLNDTGHLVSEKFIYAHYKNNGMVRDEIEAFKAQIKESPAFKEFTEKRVKICEECAELDNGGAAMKNPDGSYIIAEAHKDKFADQQGALKKKSKSVIDDREAQLKKFNEALDDDVPEDLQLHMVNYSNLPKEIIDTKSKPPIMIREGMSPGQMDSIREMISDDNEVKPKAKKKAAK